MAFGELLSFQIIKLISICACAAGDLGSFIENLDKMGLRAVELTHQYAQRKSGEDG